MGSEQVQLVQLPDSGWAFITRKMATALRESVEMMDYYYKHVDKHSNPMQNRVDMLLDDPDFWARRGGRIQHIVQRGAVRSGKSYLSICKPTEWLQKHPRTKWLCMRRTNAQLVGSLFNQIQEFCRRFRIPHTSRLPSMTGPGEIRFPNKSAFIFISSESVVLDPTSDNARGLGSMEFGGATLEEADTLHEQVVDTVPQRLSQKTGCPRAIFYNLNPTHKSHWLPKKLEKGKKALHPEDFHDFHFTLLDNIAHLDPGFVESMKNSVSANPALYKRFVLGEWGPDIIGTPIYGPYFNRDRHISPESFIETWHEKQRWLDGDVCLCWDFGFKHPALVVFQDVKYESFQQIRVLGCWLGDETTIGPLARYCINLLRPLLIGATYCSYGDPQGRNADPRGVTQLNAFDVLRAETGLNTVASKTDEQAGVDLIIDLLNRQQNHKDLGSQPELIIEPNEFYTGDFIAMMETGFANQKEAGGADVLKPVNDKYYIHLADAFRYGVVHRRQPGRGNLLLPGMGGGSGSSGEIGKRDGYVQSSLHPYNIGASPYLDYLVQSEMDIPMYTAFYGL